MKRSIIASLLIGLLLFVSSCHISAELDLYLSNRIDALTHHPVDCIKFVDLSDQEVYYAMLSQGLETTYHGPNLQVWTESWNPLRSFNLEPKEKATDDKKAVYFTPKIVKLWNQQWMVMNQESTLDFYTFSGELDKRFILPIQNPEDLILQNCFFLGEDLILVGVDKREEKTRILAITPILGVKKNWLLPYWCTQITTDNRSIFALVPDDDKTTVISLDVDNEKIREDRKLPGQWREVVFQESGKDLVIYGIQKTDTGSNLIEADSAYNIKKTHWTTQFQTIHLRSFEKGLLVFVEDTKGFYVWEPAKGLRLVREIGNATEYSAYAYYPLCVKKDNFNNLLMLDEDNMISVINIEICNPTVRKLYDSVSLTDIKLSTDKAWAKTDNRLYFADIYKKAYVMNMETKKYVPIHEFDRKVEQIEATEEGPLFLLEDSTLFRYQNNKMTLVNIPKVTILSMVVEENIPYFLLATDNKEEIHWLDPNTKQLVSIPLHISADSTGISQFAVCKSFSMTGPIIFTIEPTSDGDYLCIYDEDGKRLSNSAMSLIRMIDPIPIQQIFYYGSDKFLMVSQEYSSVFTFKGIHVE
jgi:hypothetical protein